MMQRAAALVALSVAGACCGQGWALDMNVHTSEREKLAHVNLSGSIEPGDDARFRALVTPYVKAGYLIVKANIFSDGGNIDAAMAIGDQIRLLQARTAAPHRLSKIIDNRKVDAGVPICLFDEAKDGYIESKRIEGAERCNCAGACFLIWASGVIREGDYVAVQRLHWKGNELGNLSPSEARTREEATRARYAAYLKKLDVPQTIMDRLFTADFQSIHYLTRSEHQSMQSSSYLQERISSRCAGSKGEPMNRENLWTMAPDTPAAKCYRAILKEIMREGAQKYLASLGQAAAAVAGAAPAPATQPTTAATTTAAKSTFPEKYWMHNASRMALEATGTARKFVYQVPRPGLSDAGIEVGTALFVGRREGNQYTGTAYTFSKKCGSIGYKVSGPVSEDHREVKMFGRKPLRDAQCRPVDYQDETLVFTYHHR